jgi:hypothetical protein
MRGGIAALFIVDGFMSFFCAVVDSFLHGTGPIDLLCQRIENGFGWGLRLRRRLRLLRSRAAGAEQNRERHCPRLNVTHEHPRKRPAEKDLSV